jgi:hypothetical protein
MNNCIYKGKKVNPIQFICKNKEFRKKESVIIRSEESCKTCKFKKYETDTINKHRI